MKRPIPPIITGGVMDPHDHLYVRFSIPLGVVPAVERRSKRPATKLNACGLTDAFLESNSYPCNCDLER